jgi:hypothetical protein
VWPVWKFKNNWLLVYTTEPMWEKRVISNQNKRSINIEKKKQTDGIKDLQGISII